MTDEQKALWMAGQRDMIRQEIIADYEAELARLWGEAAAQPAGLGYPFGGIGYKAIRKALYQDDA